MPGFIDKLALTQIISSAGSATPDSIADLIVTALPSLLVVETAEQGYATVKMAEAQFGSPDQDKATFAFTVVSLTAKLAIATNDRYLALQQLNQTKAPA